MYSPIDGEVVQRVKSAAGDCLRCQFLIIAYRGYQGANIIYQEVLNCCIIHFFSVVPGGGLILVGCCSLDCLNVSGGLFVADAEVCNSAASVVFALTPFADVHALFIKAVNTAK